MGLDHRANDGRKPSILVIDDNRCDYDLLCEASRERGFDAAYDHVSEGREVIPHLERMEGGPPDLILLDINLPVMNGHDILRALKQDARFSSIPVAMLSSSLRAEDRASSEKNGAVAFLMKPATFEEYFPLLSRVADILASHGGVERIRAAQPPPARPIRGLAAMRKTPRILVVHEELGVARSLREALISHRFPVLVEQARTADSALFHLSQHHNERTAWLVVLCLGLHDQAGFGLLRRLRSVPRFQGLPVMILAQPPDRDDEQHALAIGADFYIGMPDTIDAYPSVVTSCREALANHDDGDLETDDRQGAG